jgi:hypothetical protein
MIQIFVTLDSEILLQLNIYTSGVIGPQDIYYIGASQEDEHEGLSTWWTFFWRGASLIPFKRREVMSLFDAIRKGLNPRRKVVQVGISSDLAEMLENLAERPQQRERREVNFKGGMPQELREAFKRFSEQNVFRPGMIVTWKMGLRNKKVPAENGYAIVVEVYDEPFYDPSRDAGTSTYREPLDLVLGVLDPDGDFVTFHYDKRRFRPIME